MGFSPGKLLFFQPVLLEARERGQARVRRVGLTAALFMVQVRPAAWAQTPAVASANHLERQRQQHLLLQNIRQEEAFSFEKPYLRVVVFQPVFSWLQILRHRTVEQVKRPVYVLNPRLQAPRA